MMAPRADATAATSIGPVGLLSGTWSRQAARAMAGKMPARFFMLRIMNSCWGKVTTSFGCVIEPGSPTEPCDR
jgi:hypothetical protein